MPRTKKNRWGALLASMSIIALTVFAISGCTSLISIGRMEHFSEQLETTGLDKQIEDKVVLVVFWTRMSAPCTDLLASLHGLQIKYRDKGLVVITVNQDGAGSAAAIAATLQRYNIDLIILHDSGGISDEFRVEGLPAAYLFGRDHVLIDQKELNTDDLEALEAEIVKALEAK